MDIINFLPQLAAQLGVAPSTLLFWLWAVTIGSNAIANFIPADATGWRAVARRVFSFLGVEISKRISSGVKSTDIQKAALSFPEMQAKVAEAKDAKK